ncbi:hypothetical protein [Pseudarthrobacter sp. S9]|uniref:hypothetical protein n=1 Tax=Pseudarthrobacter sp. S9 TaxID=3418421 RepID=UPI003D00E627
MRGFVLYIDTSEVRPGELDALKAGLEELARFVEANEPRIIAYNAYFSEDGSRVSVVHLHPDEASLAFHMAVAGPKFAAFARLITLRTIEIFGRPSEELLQQLRQKAKLLGDGTVIVRELHAGFARFPAS